MLNFIKRLFCHHNWAISRWHWTHGISGNDPLFIEMECECTKCGAIHYEYLPQPMADRFVTQPGIEIFRE